MKYTETAAVQFKNSKDQSRELLEVQIEGHTRLIVATAKNTVTTILMRRSQIALVCDIGDFPVTIRQWPLFMRTIEKLSHSYYQVPSLIIKRRVDTRLLWP